MNKSSIAMHIMLEHIKAGNKVVFLNSEVAPLRWKQAKTLEQKEHTQNRRNARKLKRHLDNTHPLGQSRKI